MVNSTTDHTIELTPLDLLRYVEGDRPAGVMRLPDGLLCVQFAYNVSCDYEHGAGESNYEMAPVLSSRSVRKLVEMGASRYTHVGTDTRFFVVMVDGDDGITDALKQAFRAHDRGFGDFGGKDPRRVWGDYTNTQKTVPKAEEHLPVGEIHD